MDERGIGGGLRSRWVGWRYCVGGLLAVESLEATFAFRPTRGYPAPGEPSFAVFRILHFRREIKPHPSIQADCRGSQRDT